MSDIMSVTLVLTGGRAGKTCTLGKHHFVDGKCVVKSQSRAIGSVVRYMGRVYQAYPLGSEELAKVEEVANGQADADPRDGGGKADAVPGDVHQDGSAEENAVDEPGDDVGGGDPAEHRPERDGLRDSRIIEALTNLDHANDEHWTNAGKPAIHVVSQIINDNVSRAELDALAPDFKRKEG